TVYLFTRDDPGTSHCGKTCRETWPRVITHGKPQAGPGINQSKLRQTPKHQVTYYGHPLYYYAGDNATAGRTNGQGRSSFGGRWWVVSPQGKAGTGVTIRTHSTPDGSAVAGPLGSGRTLYMLSTDTTSRFACTTADGCTYTWPPLITTGRPHAGTGTSASLLGTRLRGNGTRQVTYNGHPLYYYSADSRAGQDRGQCFLQHPGTWYMLTKNGKANKTGCGSGAGATECTHPTTGTISTSASGLLIDGLGCTVYEFQGDAHPASSSTCTTAQCTSAWPPVVTTAGTHAQGGAQSGMLATISRSEGSQVTYNGYPLYYYVGDGTAGQATGQAAYAFGHHWYRMNQSGAPYCGGYGCLG
ncbi:MAG: hypothetical protein QOJ03_950, partial [Frankiaceae bacterium]|nr:hypothetical protein [Frankiaceae bacterium]